MKLFSTFSGRRPAGARRAFLALALSAAWAACAAAPLEWDGQGSAQRVLAVAAGQSESLCLPLRPPQRVVWAFVAPAPLDFELRFGDGSRPAPAVRHPAAQEARDQFEVRQNREHCWVWTNRGGQPVQVAVQLRRR